MLKFYDWYETRNNVWLILEFCTGGDLLTLIKQVRVRVRGLGYKVRKENTTDTVHVRHGDMNTARRTHFFATLKRAIAESLMLRMTTKARVDVGRLSSRGLSPTSSPGSLEVILSRLSEL